MNGKTWKIALLSLTSLMLASSMLFISGCKKGANNASSWQHDPIVPGYSMAEINIGDSFSAVQSLHGDPDQRRTDGGYQIAYYGRIAQGGNLDDPGAWELVVTFYDNGDGSLDSGDETGAIEISGAYSGTTSGSVGLGSTAQDIEGEFGSCDNISESGAASDLRLYSYDARGVDFLLSHDNEAITVIVTAYGGLRNVQENESLSGVQGGLFGIYQSAPIVPGKTVAGINIGDEFRTVKEKYGDPDSTGSTTEGLVFATYTWGYGSWKLNVYMEDKDKNASLGDFDTVVSISVRFPYKGKTPKGTTIGSLQKAVTTEFGTPEKQSTAQHQGEETDILEYNSKGIVFALNSSSADVTEIDVNKPLSP